MSEKWPIKKSSFFCAGKKLRNNETEVFYVRPGRGPVKNSVRIMGVGECLILPRSFSCFSSTRQIIKVIQEVLGNPKKRENVLDPTDRIWLLNHTNYKVPQKNTPITRCHKK